MHKPTEIDLADCACIQLAGSKKIFHSLLVGAKCSVLHDAIRINYPTV